MSDVLIKWIGSKRIQSPYILQHFPTKIKTYYEPFLGGGSMLHALLISKIEVESYVVSDLNPDLINIWKLAQTKPIELADAYEKMWENLGNGGKEYYYKIRGEFNKDKDPTKFFFLLRTCRNGLVRYNSRGEFNPSFHLKRQGMRPHRMRSTILEWSRLIQRVGFKCCDYRTVLTEKEDFVYLDPPYATPKDFPIYYGMLPYQELWGWLRGQNCKYVLSLNGIKADKDNTIDVPHDLYKTHHLIPNGTSKMDQLLDRKLAAWDSLYVY
jgi:DNA adenine methylase